MSDDKAQMESALPPVPEACGDSLKPSYPFACSKCGHEQSAKPSILMQLGRNHGSGSCTQCGELLHLRIADDGERIIASNYREWHREAFPKERPAQEMGVVPE